MKLFISSLFVVLAGRSHVAMAGGNGGGGGSNLNSCFKQSDCLKFTMTKVSPKTTCLTSDSTCEWEVCMVYDQDLPDCTKDSNISHICHKDGNTCHEATDTFQGLQQGVGELLESFPEDTPNCQIVKPGAFAGFHVVRTRMHFRTRLRGRSWKTVPMGS